MPTAWFKNIRAWWNKYNFTSSLVINIVEITFYVNSFFFFTNKIQDFDSKVKNFKEYNTFIACFLEFQKFHLFQIGLE